MKNLTIIGIILVLSCTSKKAENIHISNVYSSKPTDSLVYIHKFGKKIFVSKPDTLYSCQQAILDTSLIGISLINARSTEKVLGNIHTKLTEKNGGHPRYILYNPTTQQSLQLISHEGSTKNTFAEFEIIEGKYDTFNALYHKPFVSSLHISLGMKRTEVLTILGHCYVKAKSLDKNKEFLFHLDDYKHSQFLQHYNYPEYYIECEFKNSHLIRYRFGFYYP